MTKHQHLPITPEANNYRIAITWKYGQPHRHYIDTVYGWELFPGQYYEDAWDFYNGYALVVARGRFFHIDWRGKVAYRWRFSDASLAPLVDGTVRVQHPRAVGWSLFHIPTGTFVTNPPLRSR